MTPKIFSLIEPWLSHQDLLRAGQVNRVWRRMLGRHRARVAVSSFEEKRPTGTSSSPPASSLMLDAPQDPNAQDRFGMTPLMHAAHAGRTRRSERLEGLGADRDVRDCAGQTVEDWRALGEAATLLDAKQPERAAVVEPYFDLLYKAKAAVTYGHLPLLETALKQLRWLEDDHARQDADDDEAAPRIDHLDGYYELVHVTLRQGGADEAILHRVADWMGLWYLNDTRWREILLRLLEKPDCTAAMLTAARLAGADLNAEVKDATLADIVLSKQWPMHKLECLVDAGFVFEDDAYSRQRTLQRLQSSPKADYIVRGLIALQRCGFRLDKLLYQENSRDICQSIIGPLNAQAMDALCAAGLHFDGVGRGGKTVAHYAVGCGGWANLALLLPALSAHGVDFNAANAQGCRPIAYLMRHTDPIDEATCRMWAACGIDFDLPTKSRFEALPGASDAPQQIDCLNALSLAAMYGQEDVIGYLLQERFCSYPQSIVAAALLARHFEHDALSMRLLSLLPVDTAP